MWLLPDWSYVATKWRNGSWFDVIKSNCEQSEKQVFECFGKRECEKRHALKKTKRHAKANINCIYFVQLVGLHCVTKKAFRRNVALCCDFPLFKSAKKFSRWSDFSAWHCIVLHFIVLFNTQQIQLKFKSQVIREWIETGLATGQQRRIRNWINQMWCNMMKRNYWMSIGKWTQQHTHREKEPKTKQREKSIVNRNEISDISSFVDPL